MDVPTTWLLQNIFRRESRSFLQYIGDSFPWINKNGEDRLADLQRLFIGDKQEIGHFMEYLLRAKIAPPYVGSFPAYFTNLNFVSLEYLLPRLIEEQQRSVAALDRESSQVTDPEARVQVLKLHEVKEAQLKVLEQMKTPHLEPARS